MLLSYEQTSTCHGFDLAHHDRNSIGHGNNFVKHIK